MINSNDKVDDTVTKSALILIVNLVEPNGNNDVLINVVVHQIQYTMFTLLTNHLDYIINIHTNDIQTIQIIIVFQIFVMFCLYNSLYISYNLLSFLFG